MIWMAYSFCTLSAAVRWVGSPCPPRLRRQHHLATRILLTVEDAITVCRALQRKAVRYDHLRRQQPALDEVEQLRQEALHIGLPGLERDPLFECVAEQEAVDKTG